LIFRKPDAPQKLAVFGVRNEPIPLQLSGKYRELVQHDASDSFTAQLFSNDKIEDANGIGFNLHREHRHQLADEFAEQPGPGIGRSAMLRGKSAYRIRIVGFDRTDEELLAFHDGVNGRLRRKPPRPPNALLSCFYSISRSAK
jgi:hypothetical protein